MGDFLPQVWQALAQGLTADKKLVHNLWEEIQTAYSAKRRHYHTLEHLREMTCLAQDYGHLLKKPYLVQFAIFYHDIIYRASRSDNEANSADLAGLRLRLLGMEEGNIGLVQEKILATKTHSPHPMPDVNLLLDIDLAVLGKSWEAYEQYSRQIRKEYRQYPDFLYKPGRKKVLNQFLQRPHLYQTELFRNRWEAPARENLQRELQNLA